MNTNTNHHYIPANSPSAVYANGRRRVLFDYTRIAEQIDPVSDAPAHVLDTIHELFERVDVQYQRHTSRFRKVLPNNAPERVHDLDNVLSRPDEVASSPYGCWILGALNAMSAVQSSILLARLAGGGARQTHALLMSLLNEQLAQADRAWREEVEVMNQTSPWLQGLIQTVDLVDIAGDAPRFKVVTTARSA